MPFKIKETGYYRLALIIICTVGYLLTVARTVSLWDCGEFIASIHTLGIAHPPGSPMFMILGKAWEYLLFFIPHIALRINLLSVFCSVCACFLLFEIALIFSHKINLRTPLRNPCALLAGLMLAFSDTFWFNAVEAEVYAFSMMNMLLSVWVLLKWAAYDRNPHSRFLLLFVYTCFAGIGVHMYTMLLFPFLYFFAGLQTGRIKPGKWLVACLVVLAACFSLSFYSPPLAENSFFLLLSGLVVCGLGVFALINKEITDVAFWSTGLLLCSVISMTRPFIVAVILLWFFLSVSSVILKKNSLANWFFLTASCGLTLFMLNTVPPGELFGFSSGQLGTTLCLIIALGTILAIWLPGKSNMQAKYPQVQFFRAMLLLVIIGYSSHIYLPVRANQNPVINENNPANWHRVEGFIERKQYGNENMLVRMFNRRGDWDSQFGYGANMGFFRYHAGQYFSHGLFGIKPGTSLSRGMYAHSLIAFLLLISVLLVIFENLRRNPGWMGILLLLYAVTSVGLVLYMNFADGNRLEVSTLKRWQASAQIKYTQLGEKVPQLPALPDANAVNWVVKNLNNTPKKRDEILSSNRGLQYSDWKKLKRIGAKAGIFLPEIPGPVHREVRNRHYFFTPAFVLFSLMLSLAIFITLDKSISRFPGGEAWIKRTGIVLSFTLWLLPFLSHYSTHDRSDDFIAADFAYNLLQSCPRDGILFTNGDNDTFPLWYLQQVEKVRTDVSVINFSLANTDWYPIQFTQHEPRVRLPAIERGGGFPPSKYIRFKRTQIIPLPGDTSISLKLGGKGVSRFIRGQDRMLIETALYNYPQRPLCFTLATPALSTLGLDQHFQNAGLVNIVSPNPGIDLQKLEHNLFDVYRYRNNFNQHSTPSGKWLLNNYKRVLQTGKQARIQKIQRMKYDSLPGDINHEMKLLGRYMELEKKLISGNR